MGPCPAYRGVRGLGSSAAAEFDSYVAARSAALFRTATLLLAGDAAAAADVVQDTMIDIWRRWPRIRTMERVDGYAHRILVTNVLRHGRKGRRFVVADELPDQPAGDAIQLATERHDLWSVVRRLPEMQRAVVVLRYFEDMTEAQTAEVLDISVGTVKSHMSRALVAMRAGLPDEFANGGTHD